MKASMATTRVGISRFASTVLLLTAGYASACPSGSQGLPPSVPEDDSLVQRGLLAVTHFGAIPGDDKDDTRALQIAVDTARDYGMAAFFPSGEYLVSDTLRVMQPVSRRPHGWHQNRRCANALIGSTRGARPVIRLMPNSAGFASPGQPKPVVWVWAQPRNTNQAGSEQPEDEQPNISFNQVIKGIDLDLRGEGLSGAVGIRHAGSQGSSIEEVTIHAGGAYAGLYNLPGQGGGVYDLTVIGGRYGIWADHKSRYPVAAGVRLRDQQKAAVFWRGQSNLTLAGFIIERSKSGPSITLQRGRRPYNRTLTLVDGIIRGHGELALDNRAGRNLYLHNVHFSGYKALVRSAARRPVSAAGALTAVGEYAYVGPGSMALVDGRPQEAGHERIDAREAAEAPDQVALLGKHLWQADMAGPDDAAAVSIVRYGALPDDGKDDTAAIQRALDRHHKVLIPPGTFTVSDTLLLGPQTQLLGVAKHLSVIRGAADWEARAGIPIVSTVDDPAARTTLSFLLIERPAGRPGMTLLQWRAGRHSVVRDVMGGQYGRPPENARETAISGATYAVRGNGGGRWYGLAAEWNRMSADTAAPGYRHLRVEGTRQSLAFYGLNIERGLADPQAELRDAHNVAIYSLKGESRGKLNGAATVLQLQQARNVWLFGYSGNAAPRNNAVLRVSDSKNYSLANLVPVRPGTEFDTIRVSHADARVAVDGVHPAALVRHGRPVPLVWSDAPEAE